MSKFWFNLGDLIIYTSYQVKHINHNTVYVPLTVPEFDGKHLVSTCLRTGSIDGWRPEVLQVHFPTVQNKRFTVIR